MQNITETLGIGSRAPDFRLGAANSSLFQTLGEWTAKGPVVLEFLRGTWCHNCRKRLPELEMLQTTLWAEGANLVCIAAEKRDGIWKPEEYLREHRISFSFLLDEDRTVIKAYGLYHRVGIDAWNIAHPATLVIDRDSRVRYIYKGVSQSDRAPVGEVLKAVSKIASGPGLPDSTLPRGVVG
jgi:methyl-accepting chemotaxis protein